MGVPANLEACVERRYLADMHILALVCDDEVLAERLLSRPEWRRSGDADFVAEQIRFNQWFRDRGSGTEPAIEVLDTTGTATEETAGRVAAWIASRAGR